MGRTEGLLWVCPRKVRLAATDLKPLNHRAAQKWEYCFWLQNSSQCGNKYSGYKGFILPVNAPSLGHLLSRRMPCVAMLCMGLSWLPHGISCLYHDENHAVWSRCSVVVGHLWVSLHWSSKVPSYLCTILILFLSWSFFLFMKAWSNYGKTKTCWIKGQWTLILDKQL